MQQPSMGRIVIYSIPAHGVVAPAIIGEVLAPGEELAVSLTVFGVGGVPAQYRPCVAHVSELVACDRSKPANEQPVGHRVLSDSTPRWDWPPRVG